jgi:SAM-dependent methyltransferase
LGGVDVCRLPFQADSFDCAVSQFGIEYADVQGACGEVARVLKPASRGLFLVHHSESAITSAARARLQAFACVIGNGMAFDRARQVYEGIAHGAGESAAATQLSEFRQSVSDAVAVHSTECPWETNLREILHFLSDLARNPQIYDPRDALRRVAAARDMIAAWKSRQESQLVAARDEAGMRAFAETMRRSVMEPGDITVVNDPVSGAVLAWRLAFAATGSR